MARIRIGFIGTGDVLLKYYLPTVLQAQDSIEIVAVCSADAARAARMADALGASEAYGDYEQMLGSTSAELIVNLTPAQLHYQSNLAVLDAGKHLYSEKPLARTVGEADELISRARARGVEVRSAPSVVYDPAFRALYRLIRSHDVGHVAFANANAFQGGPITSVYDARRAQLIRDGGLTQLGQPEEKPDQAWFYQKGGGPLYDYGIYQISLLTGLLGPVQRVTALSGIISRKQREKTGKIRTRKQPQTLVG